MSKQPFGASLYFGAFVTDHGAGVYRAGGCRYTRGHDDGAGGLTIETDHGADGQVGEEFLAARRVALIGATSGDRDMWSYNARMTRSLLASDFDEVVLVSRREAVIAGHRTVATIGEYQGEPGDLCVLAVPQGVLVATIEGCVSAGWSHFLVITGQVDPATREELRSMSPSMARIWGPNCTGFFVTQSNRRVMASDFDPPWRPGRRRVAILGQSGGALGNIAVMASGLGVNVSHVLSTGEEIDVGCEDLLVHFARSRTTDAAIVFVEEARRPLAFLAALDQCAAADIPVIVIKVGRNARARNAAQSHSQALVGDWDEFVAATTAHGGIACTSFREAAGVAAIAANTIGKRRGSRTAVFTSSGGSGVLVCDLAEQAGLDLDVFSKRAVGTLTRLAKFGTREVNPFDSAQGGGTPSCLPTYLETVRAEPGIDTVMVMHGGSVYADFIAGELAKFSAENNSVVAVWPGIAEALRETLLDSGVTVIDDPGDACRWLALTGPAPVSGPKPSRRRHSTDAEARHEDDDFWLSYEEASGLLRGAGLDAPRQWASVASPDDVARVIDEVSGHYPVVVKGSTLRGHKRALGGVTTGVSDAPGLRRAVEEIALRFGRATVEEQVAPGVEVLVSVIDGPFGGVIVLGLGGSFADAFGRQLVLSANSPHAHITRRLVQSGVGRILTATEGPEAASRGARAVGSAARHLVRLVRTQGLHSVEVNPLIVSQGRATACDVKAQTQVTSTNPRKEI